MALTKNKQLLKFLLLLVWTSWVHADEKVVFYNFSEEIELLGSNSQYAVKNSELSVTLSNRLIIKTSKHLNPQIIKTMNPHIERVWIAYQGNDFDYYVAVVDDKNLLYSVLKTVEKDSQVIRVQPDISQLRYYQYQKTLLAHNMAAESHPRLATTGNNVTLAIIDDGFDFSHPSLKHVQPIFSFDITNGDTDVSPKNTLDTHGTQVAGLLFAEDDQFPGLTRQARLVAIRQPDTWTSNTLLAFQLAQLAGADVINCSWHSQWLLEPVRDVVVDLSIHGRQGKGVAVIFPAGNQGREIVPFESESGLPEAIVVGMNHSPGKRAGFSNFGETVDLYITAAHGLMAPYPGGGYKLFSGTSLAVVLMSARIAGIIERQPDISLAQIQQRLSRSSSE